MNEKRIAGDGTSSFRSYVYALGKHLARVDGAIGGDADVFYYHTDHLGSVRAVTDAYGKEVWRSDYKAFGSGLNRTEGFEEWHTFTGKEYDPDAELYYFNARWYDPELGRFISEDPVGDPNSPNLYVYCANNPLTRFDPTGLLIVGDDQPYSPGEPQSHCTGSISRPSSQTTKSSDTSSSSPEPAATSSTPEPFIGNNELSIGPYTIPTDMNILAEELKQKYPKMDIEVHDNKLIIKTNGHENVDIPQLGLSINAEFIVIGVSVDKSGSSIQTNFSIYAQDYLYDITAGLEHEKTDKSIANKGKDIYAPALNHSSKYAALSVDLSFSSEGHISADMKLITEPDAGLILACYIERGNKRFFPKDEPWSRNDDISIGISDPVLCDFDSSFDLDVNRYEPATFYLGATIGPSGSMPIRYDKIWIEVKIY